MPDLQQDERFSDNPLLLSAGLRFYAGVPFIDDAGNAYGTLCVMDYKPLSLTSEQLEALRHLAEHVDLLLAKRRAIHLLKVYQSELEAYQRSSGEEQALLCELMTRMLRPERLNHPALEYWNQPAEKMGGDFLAAARAANDKFYVMLADSMGHGLPAAVSLLPVSDVFYDMVDKPGHTPLISSRYTPCTPPRRPGHSHPPRWCVTGCRCHAAREIHHSLECHPPRRTVGSGCGRWLAPFKARGFTAAPVAALY